MRRALAALVAVLVSLGAGTALAAELVMVESEGCPFCVRWHREIGPIYPKTEEGIRAPLRRVSLRALPADLRSVKNLRYAPTFLVMQCGREAGRIVGYGGDDFFWGELSAILRNLKSKSC
ncbi:hypothetical protein [Magnetospirillum moscoviense]|uniref:Thioredoxin-like fold domain-containing protein n=1 Tax=Magnetospirillum moscoviense TaxID=1437059 RepID=A0A178M4R2_9PROT|nr:hypothetical protein [Magnetospirillum moscoviense]MBF0324189.1 hypothetical protein [Alphaproteobacteria bacterium]OAN43742.1 hypothetical protein A6A05_05205 [Magnetospirillum moscoviense]